MSSKMIAQTNMIARVEHLCREDNAVVAAMMYGSFALGGGDRYSDIEFMLFFKDEVLETLDKGAWLAQVAPVALHFTNEYGVTAVIFCSQGDRSFGYAQDDRSFDYAQDDTIDSAQDDTIDGTQDDRSFGYAQDDTIDGAQDDRSFGYAQDDKDFGYAQDDTIDGAQDDTIDGAQDDNTVLVRGEFHFDKISALPQIAAAWPGEVWFPSLEDTLIVDKTGVLTPYLRPLIGPPLEHGQTSTEVQTIVNRFFNWYLFGLNVLERGEYARALELLWFVQRHLLLMARILEDTTTHWHIPSRALEGDLSSKAYARYVQCTAALNAPALHTAYRNAWAWGTEMLEALNATYDLNVPPTVLKALQARVESNDV